MPHLRSGGPLFNNPHKLLCRSYVVDRFWLTAEIFSLKSWIRYFFRRIDPSIAGTFVEGKAMQQFDCLKYVFLLVYGLNKMTIFVNFTNIVIGLDFKKLLIRTSEILIRIVKYVKSIYQSMWSLFVNHLKNIYWKNFILSSFGAEIMILTKISSRWLCLKKTIKCIMVNN
jgi:hypothetical protein